MAVPMIYVIVPTIAVSWPAILPIITAAAGALGYGVSRENNHFSVSLRNKSNNVELVLPNTEILAQTLQTESELLFTKGDIRLVINRDIRGKCKINIWGSYPQSELEETGRIFAQEIIQQYVYHKISNELPRNGFSVVNEKTDDNNSIHLQIRRWR